MLKFKYGEICGGFSIAVLHFLQHQVQRCEFLCRVCGASSFFLNQLGFTTRKPGKRISRGRLVELTHSELSAGVKNNSLPITFRNEPTTII